MRTLFSDFFYDTGLKGVLAFVIVGAIAFGSGCGGSGTNTAVSNTNVATNTEPTEEVPPIDEIETMAKATTAQFAEAVETGDFSRIRDEASADFQNTYTVEQISTAFKSYTDKKDIVVPILKNAADVDAEFPKPPTMRGEKGLNILVTNGTFPTKPHNTRFDYEYVMRDGEWKLLRLVVNIP